MFSIEGKFFKALTKAGDFLILGFLGFVFSIPVITMGASITAMFYVGMKLVRDELFRKMTLQEYIALYTIESERENSPNNNGRTYLKDLSSRLSRISNRDF